MKLTTINLIKDLACLAFIVWVLSNPLVRDSWAWLGIICLFSSYKIKNNE